MCGDVLSCARNAEGLFDLKRAPRDGEYLFEFAVLYLLLTLNVAALFFVPCTIERIRGGVLDDRCFIGAPWCAYSECAHAGLFIHHDSRRCCERR